MLDVDGWHAHRKAAGEILHVVVDGLDQTTRCVRADDTAGTAVVFCEDPALHRPLQRGGPKHLTSPPIQACQHVLTGLVRIIPGPPFEKV